MKSIRQTILSIKIEYHYRRAKKLQARVEAAKSPRKEGLYSSINLHKYKAEKALIEYEISEGLRNSHGIWTGLRFQY